MVHRKFTWDGNAARVVALAKRLRCLSMTPQRLIYVLQIFPKLSETFVAGELAELRRRGVEVRILSLLPPRAELQHEIIRRAGLAELTTYDVEKFPSVIREFQPQLLARALCHGGDGQGA